MQKTIALFFLSCLCVFANDSSNDEQQGLLDIAIKNANLQVQVAQISENGDYHSKYPGALNNLLEELNKQSNVSINPLPFTIMNFEDDSIFRFPILYVNYAHRKSWKMSEKEISNLRKYINNGGFIFIDAGINSEFLRKSKAAGQSHSFADWEVSPDLNEAFAKIFPENKFLPLERSHNLFKIHFKGLPDDKVLPDTVRDYVVNEKWPDGTHSVLAMKVKGRISVVATPILAMGWGRKRDGTWQTNISFRILESAHKLKEFLKTASSKSAYKAKREDGLHDTIHATSLRPSWAVNPDGTTRMYRYYSGDTINDFAHQFHIRLGINILIYALVQ